MSAEITKPSMFLRALRFVGLGKYEIQIIESLRILATVFAASPRLARELLSALPIIQQQIINLENTMGGTRRGPERLKSLMDWLLKKRPTLTHIASLAEVAVAVRAIATMLVSSFNQSGMFPASDHSD